MKRVLAIGDLTEQTPPARTLAPPLVKTETTSKDVRKAAGPAVWVQQNDGSWAIKWRGNDTWWDLSARYLQSGKRWRELFTYQSDAFHARVPQPIAIYTTAIVAMPPEAVQRAQLLNEIPGGGASGASAQPSPKSGGAGAAGGSGSSGTAGAGASSPSSSPGSSSGGSGGPIVLPAPPSHGGGSGNVLLWILGAIGVAGVAGIGVLAYRAHQAEQEGRA